MAVVEQEGTKLPKRSGIGRSHPLIDVRRMAAKRTAINYARSHRAPQPPGVSSSGGQGHGDWLVACRIPGIRDGS